VVALKTHLVNGFFAPTKVLLKVLVLSIAILFFKVLVLLLPILFCTSIGIGNTFGKYC